MLSDIDLSRIETYLLSLSRPYESAFEALLTDARSKHIPVSKNTTLDILSFFISLKQPKHILEIGTAVGASAIHMCRFCDDDCRLTTIENNAENFKQAAINVTNFGLGERIHTMFGDALEILYTLPKVYDFCFIDAAKGQYPFYLKAALPLMKGDSIIISDNIFQEGKTLEARYAIDRRDRTTHGRMRDFLLSLSNDERLKTIFIPLGDGVAVTQRLPEKQEK